MEIKQIRLSPKRGGNGFVSSYSINIGAKEARECFGLKAGEDPVFVKLLDPEAGQIIIRPKGFTLTQQVLERVCAFAEQSLKLHRMLEPVRTHPSEVDSASDETHHQQIRSHDEDYYSYLVNLPLEALTDLITLLCMGRDADVDLTLPPAQRFLRYWQQLEQYGSFTLGSDALAGQLMYNLELETYLKKGLTLMGQPL